MELEALPMTASPNDKDGGAAYRRTIWGVKWHWKNRLDGARWHWLNVNCVPALFTTRKQAREHIEKHYGYLRTRPDLKAEPFGWKMPVAVRVTVSLSARLQTQEGRRPTVQP